MKIDWGKVIVILAIVGCLTTLGALEVISGDFVQSAITLILGVVIGNGKTIASKEAPGPIVSARTPPPE